MVTDREDGQIPELNNQGQTRLLGECTLALGPLTSALTDISGMGVRQHLKFTRTIGNEQKTVGRFIVNLKLVGEQVIPLADEKPIEQDEIFHQLPASDPFMNFNWRLRVDVRSGIDLPLNRNEVSGGLPTSFVELGWTMYENQPPDDYQMYLTKLVEGNRHPIWNQQFLIPNPQAIQGKDGFLYVGMKDRHS